MSPVKLTLLEHGYKKTRLCIPSSAAKGMYHTTGLERDADLFSSIRENECLIRAQGSFQRIQTHHRAGFEQGPTSSGTCGNEGAGRNRSELLSSGMDEGEVYTSTRRLC